MPPLYIMSGGKSSRFGSDKARALLGEETLLEHVVRTLGPVTSSVTVIADEADKYADLGLRTIADLTSHLGPMGGLQTALTHLQSEMERTSTVAEECWCFLASCDMAGLQREWIQQLWEQQTEDTQILAFGPEPWDSMFAWYRLDLLPEVNRRLAKGQRAMWRLLQEKATAIPHPADWHKAISINTPKDMERYLEKHPYTLQEMLQNVSEENRHEQIETGDMIGKEKL